MIKVHLNQIPVEGLHIEGEADADCLGLKELAISALGPLKYALDIGLSDGGLFATGNLFLKVQLQCVATLEDFPYEIAVENFATQVELKGPEVVDLTPMIREDILLNLPSYPRIDREGAQNLPHKGQAEISSPTGEDKSGSPAWDVLNQLKIKK